MCKFKICTKIQRLIFLKSNHFQKIHKHLEPSFAKRFGEQIRHIVICVNLRQMNEFTLIAISNKMNFDVDVLGLDRKSVV